MPIPRSSVQSAPPQDGLVQFCYYTNHSARPAQQMQCVSYGQDIEEGVAHIGRETESLRSKLQPGKSLAHNKQNTQEQCDVKPARGTCYPAAQAAHKPGNITTPGFQGDAAGQDQ